MQSWKTHSRTTVLNHSKFLTVESRVVEAPGGQMIENWPWVIARDFVNVIPITAEGNILVFRQGKYGFEGESIAPVGGYMEPGEEPESAARRELLEEMGYAAGEMIPLVTTLVSPNMGFATGHVFLARQISYQGEFPSDDLEEQTLVELTREELEQALLAGQIKVTSWYAAFAGTLLWLHRMQTS